MTADQESSTEAALRAYQQEQSGTGVNSKKGKMTEEEEADSLEFLRSRGVLVETPEDRAGAADAAKELSGLQIGAPNTRSFRYVVWFKWKGKEEEYTVDTVLSSQSSCACTAMWSTGTVPIALTLLVGVCSCVAQACDCL